MHKSAKERRSVIFVTLALSITGFLITVALISRSDYMVSNDSTKNSIHQSESKIHGPKNFTAAARIVERSGRKIIRIQIQEHKSRTFQHSIPLPPRMVRAAQITI